MKILILGGNGFIGSQIAKELLTLGYEVYSASRLRTYGALPRGVTEVFYDRSASTMGPATDLTTTQWDACIDCSSYTPDHITRHSPSLCDNVAHYIFIRPFAHISQLYMTRLLKLLRYIRVKTI